ncbi:surface protein PspC [Streptococcus pneumoniae]|nr:surface protein PspC [Streptococcus pneumoniae]VQE73984.1 surface protein PspC [Streptococcus pneumoniae]VQR18140.1 surface protein PspC [Streptococcus pneumoniae]VSK73715.1 surface protein PspC [Streptococcus pneumoniae]VTF25536.1 surface protein PspC [Streptococcus pneumoniae]
MFKSNHERRMRYSIRKFSVGVASVAVASLFMGSVVHATEREGSTQAATSSKMANESQIERRKAAEQAIVSLSGYMTSLLNDGLDTSDSRFEELLKRAKGIVEEYRKKIDGASDREKIEKLQQEGQTKLDELVDKFKKGLSSSEQNGHATPKDPSRNDGVQGDDSSVGQGEQPGASNQKNPESVPPTASGETDSPTKPKTSNDSVNSLERELKEVKETAKTTLNTYMLTRLKQENPGVFWFADLLRESKESVEKYKRMFDEASSKENVENLVKEAKQEIEALVVKHKGREIDLERTKAKTVIAKYLTGLLDDIKKNLKKEQHINTVELIKKLGDIKRTYLYKLDESTQKAQLQELVTESQSKLDEAFSKFKNGLSSSSSSGSSTKPETPQPEKPEHQKPTTPAPDTKPSPQPEGKKPSVPDINQEKEKAKLAVATYMSKILDDIQKHHLQKEKHRQIVALIKELDELKKQALSEIDNVNTKVEIENTVHKIFADMDAVVTKFKKGLTQDTPKEPGNKKPSAPKPGMQPSPQPEVKPQLEKPKPGMQPSPQPEVKPQLEKPKPEVKPQPEKPKPEVKPQLEKPKPEVKPQPEKPKPEVKPQPEKPKPEVKPQLEKPKPGMQPSPQPEVKPQLEKPKPEVKPQPEKPKPEVKPQLEKPKPEVKPQPEKPKPEVKPQLEKPKPEVKPQPEKPKPEVKPQPEKPKPEVKPQPEKPKPEVKPQLEKPKPDNSKPQADDKKPSTTNNLSKDKQPSNQASTNEKATNKPKKSLPSTGSISNLALEIAGLLTLAGATILAKKRMK